MDTILTRLEEASRVGDVDSLKRLLEEDKMEGIDAIFTKLEEASRTGDVDSLNNLLEEDKFLLERVITRTSARDNPLHVAALLGHAGFAAEIISRKPELAKELNGQGLLPLHLAAAHGHLLVVKEFLKAALDLCLVKEEKEGLMPLHVAIIKGRTLIVKVLIEACEEAMHERTDGGETVLHLAVKSNSLEILEFLISQVNDLNAKDDRGNTVLHLAVARKKLSVIKLLLSNPRIDVNSMNSKAFTPLDILLELPQEYGDLLLGEIIRAAGGKTRDELVPSQLFLPNANSSEVVGSTRPMGRSDESHSCRVGSKDDTGKASLESQKKTKRKKHNPDILVVVAILIATITFQAALTPPGGFQPDDIHRKGNNLRAFLACDMIGLFLSISVILLFLCVVPRKRKIVIKFLVCVLWFATFSTALAFSAAINQIYFGSEKAILILFVGWIGVLMLGILWVAIRLITCLLKKGKLLKPIQRFFSLLMKRPWRRQRLNGATTQTTNQLKICSCLKRTVYIVLILFILAAVGFIYLICVCTIVFLI